MSKNDFREIINDENIINETVINENTINENTINENAINETVIDGEVIVEENYDSEDKDYEDICYICHRTERIAGKMIKIPGNICICSDCMQRTFDTMNYGGFPMDGYMMPSDMF